MPQCTYFDVGGYCKENVFIEINSLRIVFAFEKPRKSHNRGKQ